jgi:hypothetical protein
MGIFDKAKDLLGEHSDKVAAGIDKVGDLVDEKTGGTYADKVDQGQDVAKERLGEFSAPKEPERPA